MVLACTEHEQDLRIIDTKAKSFSPVNLSEVFSAKRMIKLTTNDSIVMGKIIDLEFSRGFIFTNEIRGMNRYLTKFSHDGNYIGLIGTIGHGPGEYALFFETAFDTVMQRIVLKQMQNS